MTLIKKPYQLICFIINQFPYHCYQAVVGIFFYLYIYIFFLHYNTTTHFFYTSYTTCLRQFIQLQFSYPFQCLFLHIFYTFLSLSKVSFLLQFLLPLCFASLSLCSFHSLGSSFASQLISPSFLQVSVLALLGLVSLFELWQFLIANF